MAYFSGLHKPCNHIMARMISMDILVHEVQRKCQAGKETTFLFQYVNSLSLIEYHYPGHNKGADS